MNNLVDYFKTSGTRLGVFYPTHYLIAVFRNPAGAEFAVHKLWNAGFASSDAIAADGKAVLEFDKADLPPILRQTVKTHFSLNGELSHGIVS